MFKASVRQSLPDGKGARIVDVAVVLVAVAAFSNILLLPQDVEKPVFAQVAELDDCGGRCVAPSLLIVAN